MSHGMVVVLDQALRNFWHPKSTLTNALDVHSWWRKIREFELTGE